MRTISSFKHDHLRAIHRHFCFGCGKLTKGIMISLSKSYATDQLSVQQLVFSDEGAVVLDAGKAGQNGLNVA